MFHVRPPKPRYSFTCDVNVLFTFLESWCPLSVLDLKQLTLKTAALVALVLAHRSQTLSALCIEFFNSTATGLGTQFVVIQEIIKVREWIPHIGPLTRVIHLNLFLDMVPSSSANFTRAIFTRCVFSWKKQRRREMADRASSKRKFEVSNAPSNKRKKTSSNLFCSKERTWTLCDRNKIENLLLLECTRSYAAIRCVLF